MRRCLTCTKCECGGGRKFSGLIPHDFRCSAAKAARRFPLVWCPEGDLNPHDRLRSADFKSAASADFAIRARLYIMGPFRAAMMGLFRPSLPPSSRLDSPALPYLKRLTGGCSVSMTCPEAPTPRIIRQERQP